MYGGVQQLRTSYGFTNLLDANGNSVWGARTQYIGQMRLGFGLRLGSVVTVTPSLTLPFRGGKENYYLTGLPHTGQEADYKLTFSFRIPR